MDKVEGKDTHNANANANAGPSTRKQNQVRNPKQNEWTRWEYKGRFKPDRRGRGGCYSSKNMLQKPNESRFPTPNPWKSNNVQNIQPEDM
ncbi:hypothetical protein CCACVL1_12499 [Corchorus capsularis]|uniref:Uncharacterized protein n=1 Tax=Corchorus capsularis TaxID=210143 RepID=A0A1R3IFJ2_COCAP|nr:hypothetical protein CCACVL1_12499 [Corchorus capsularis]